MKKSLTNAQMRMADRFTIDEMGVPSLTLMERAGAGVAAQVETLLSSPEDGVLVVCGGGNNGGDGFVAARLLAEKGIDVQALCLAEHFSADCAAVKEKYKGEILHDFPVRHYAVIVDCIFGTGLSRTVGGREKELIGFINRSGSFVLSVDIPSGLNGDNGCVMGDCVCADRTVTIGEYKNGLFLNDGIDRCGEVVRIEIGIDSALTEEDCVYLTEEEDIRSLLPKRKRNSNKGTYGRASILAGSTAYSGAPLLTASAALRAGAGYTQLCVCEELFHAFLGRLPEVILTAFPGKERLSYDEESLNGVLKSDCIAVGPGCGVSEELYRCIVYLLKNYSGKLVLDADALNALSRFGIEVLAEKKCEVLLTPHVKEFSRLIGLSVSEVQADPVACARSFAARYGVNVLLKSAVSVITDGKRGLLQTRGSACLAKGGSGDVLTGIIAGLAAQGLNLFDSAQAGSFLLGVSAELCEAELGVHGVIASDVVACLPRAWVALTRVSAENSDE